MSGYEAPKRQKQNPSILLGSGTYFDYTNPAESKITIEDYAAGLAFQSRFQGQCCHPRTKKRIYYSIAQHAVIGSFHVPSELAYEFLMHESGESVCGDMVSPLKSLIPQFKEVERSCEMPIAQHFGVKVTGAEIIKQVDLRMWITERNQLMNWDGIPWSGEGFGDPAKQIMPFNIVIHPLGPHEAFDLFLMRWKELAPPHIVKREYP